MMIKQLTVACLLLCSSAALAQDHIVVVFDNSASMRNHMQSDRSRSRMDVAHEVLPDVLSKVNPSTQIGILNFNGWAYDFGPVEPTKIRQAIVTTSASVGSTPLWKHMKMAADKLLEARSNNNNVGRYKIVVVTDGEAGDEELASDVDWRGNPKEVPGYLTDIQNRGIIIDAIGLDMKKAHSLSTKVNGSYMRGDDPTSLREAVAAAVAEATFDDQSADDEVLQMISEMPDDFAFAVVSSLSVFHNQPIGEEPPPIRVSIETGQVVPPNVNVDPGSVVEIESGPVNVDDGGAMGWLGMVVAAGVGIAALFLLLFRRGA